MAPRSRGRGGSCVPCRNRHVKCDRRVPTCSNCTKSRFVLECGYESPQTKSQARVLIYKPGGGGRRPRSTNLQYLSPGSSSGSPSDSQVNDESVPQHASVEPSMERHDGASETFPVDHRHLLPQQRHSPDAQVQPVLPDLIELVPGNGLPQEAPEDIAVHPETPRLPLPTVPDAVRPHLASDATEACIFSFYLEIVGPWLDIVSPTRFFGIEVPRIAVKEPVLYAACLAYASHVLYLHKRIPLQVKEDLHDRALRKLIPVLSSYRQGPGHDFILATMVLLRMTEQFLEPDQDHQHHLYGSSTLFQTSYNNSWLCTESLSTTSFWAYLRGSIRVSILHERPCPFSLDYSSIMRDYSSRSATLSDEMHTNMITYLLAQLCSACWGDRASAENAGAPISGISEAISDWTSRLPASFQPWYVQFNEGNMFPDVRYLAPWHYVAWQFYYAARIMLAVYSPTVRNAVNVLELTRMLEESITRPHRWLCGVTLCANMNGVKINGSHLVAWSAQFVTGRAEQSKILGMLASLEDETGWPSRTCCARLRGLWDGSRRSWVNEQ